MMRVGRTRAPRYGWHFPEFSKLIQDHQTYARVLKAIGDQAERPEDRPRAQYCRRRLAERVKQEAEIDMVDHSKVQSSNTSFRGLTSRSWT